MTIRGTIQIITYRNDENGYSVVRLDVDGEDIVCVGTFPPLVEGQSVECTGEFVINPRYGRQFRADSVVETAPNSADDLVRFLGSGLFPGVGPKTALTLVQHFGMEVLEVIEFSPQRLRQIRGMSPRKIAQITASYRQTRAKQQAIVFLQSLGISLKLALKIEAIYQARTVATVRSNPYQLIEDVEGVGFVTADRIALQNGLAPDSPARIRAGILHILTLNCERQGNTCMGVGELVDEAARLLGQDPERVSDMLGELAIARRVKLWNLDGQHVAMMINHYFIEMSIAQRLAQIREQANAAPLSCQREIQQFESSADITLHERQREAVRAAAECGVVVITGGPGTGKTTIIRAILDVFVRNNLSTILLAPTGRAAKRMSQATGLEASTIHRALLTNVGGVELGLCDAVIVDEMSMVDVFLMHNLLRALKPGVKLVMVGDRDQLPSVGAGNVLGDIITSADVPVIALSYIYRQSGQSLIVSNAHRINSGTMPILDDNTSDFFHSMCNGPAEICDRVVDLVTRRLPAFLDIDPARIQVLSAMKSGEAGVNNLNRVLQAALNPPEQSKTEMVRGELLLRLGDKVMHIVNNYQLEWRRAVGYMFEEGKGVYNGDMGTIIGIDNKLDELTVEFEDGRVAVYSSEDRRELVLAYAVTVHKSQGSEFEVVVMPIVSGSPQILTRNLLYTAITRARRTVVLVGMEYHIRRMVANNYIQHRLTALGALLAQSADIGAQQLGDDD